jgi:hypothetical protein
MRAGGFVVFAEDEGVSFNFASVHQGIRVFLSLDA